MHDGDELRLEPGLYIMDDMLDGGGNGIPSGERGVHNHAEVFDLEVSLV